MQRAMTADDALDRLNVLLDDRTFNRAEPRLDLLWSALREWVAIPVVGVGPDSDDDLLLFQAHLFDDEATAYSPGPRFVVSFTRQFSYVKGEEYAGMEHLMAEVTYPNSPATRALVRGPLGAASQIWGDSGPRCARWIRDVESDRSFQAAADMAPTGFEPHPLREAIAQVRAVAKATQRA